MGVGMDGSCSVYILKLAYDFKICYPEPKRLGFLFCFVVFLKPGHCFSVKCLEFDLSV